MVVDGSGLLWVVAYFGITHLLTCLKNDRMIEARRP